MTTTHHTFDAGSPQVGPCCSNYLGERPVSRPTRRDGTPRLRLGYCPSCKAEVRLNYLGRLPDHEPGPPPFVDCPGCNDWLPGWYPALRVENGGHGGAYNDIDCPNCVAAIEGPPS